MYKKNILIFACNRNYFENYFIKPCAKGWLVKVLKIHYLRFNRLYQTKVLCCLKFAAFTVCKFFSLLFFCFNLLYDYSSVVFNMHLPCTPLANVPVPLVVIWHREIKQNNMKTKKKKKNVLMKIKIKRRREKNWGSLHCFGFIYLFKNFKKQHDFRKVSFHWRLTVCAMQTNIEECQGIFCKKLVKAKWMWMCTERAS